MAEAAIRAGCAIDESASRGKAISVASMLAVGEMLPGNIDAHASPFTVSAALKQWGMELARRIGDAYLLHSGWLGDDNFRCGDLPATRAIIEDTIAFKKEYGLDGELWWSLEQLSVVLTLQGEREAVLTLVADARRFADKLGVPFIQFKAEDMELAVYRALRDWGQAIPLARNMLERYGASDFGLRCRRVLAQCLIADGAFSEGAELLDRYFAEIAAMRLERDDFRLAAARAARRRAEFGLGGDASVAARAAGAALQVIGTQILRFPPEASYRPVVSFALPAGFLVADLAELNWSGYIDEAHAFHDLLAAASAALEWHSFCTLLSEGRSMGLVAIWPISPSETGG
jgi:hypothetical protein